MSGTISYPVMDQVVFVTMLVLVCCVCGFLLCFVFLLDYGLISQNWGNQSKHTFTSLLIRSFIQHLLYVRGNPVMASTLGGCSLVGEIPTNCNMSYRSALGR